MNSFSNLIKAIILILLLFPQYTFAQVDNNALKISKEIYSEFLSPFCPGRSLSDCPSTKASKLKEDIYNNVSSGQDKEVVLDNLFKEFGYEYSSKPRFYGISSLAWLIPIGFLVVLLLSLFFWIRKNSKS